MAIQAPPPTLDVMTPTARRRRRWVPWVTAYGSCLLIAALSLIGYGVAHYSPIALGGSSYVGPQPAPYVSQVQVPGTGENVYVIKYTSGKDFSIGFDIANRGRFGITVTAIPVQSMVYWHVISTQMGPGDERAFPPPTTAIHPFSLLPGHTRWIEVHFHMPLCPSVDSSSGGYSTLISFPFRFRYFGVSRSQDVALPSKIALEASGRGCGP